MSGPSVNETHFVIVYNNDRRLMTITLYNHWSYGILSSFNESFGQAIKTMEGERLRSESRPNLLVDARAAGVQGKMVVSGLQYIAAVADRTFHRQAIVVHGALHKLQSRRISPSGSHQTFFEIGKAVDWLGG